MNTLITDFPLTNQVICITGVAGFIGSHCCRRLLASNPKIKVVGIDNFNAHYSKKIKTNRIFSLKKEFGKRFVFYQKSTANKKAIKELLLLHKPELVVHLAAEVGVRKGEDNQESYFKTNLMGTANFLGLLDEKQLKHVVVASSSAVYGNSPGPFSEKEQLGPTVPLSVYGGSKLAMESVVYQFYRKTRIPTTVIRPFSVYGPDGRPDMLPFILIKAAWKKKTVEVFGDPALIARDWTHVYDVTEGIEKILVRPDEFSTVNLGRGKLISLKKVLYIAQKALAAKGLTLKYKQIGKNIIEMEKTWADISLARKKYGYKPTLSFEKNYPFIVEDVLANKNLYLE